MLDEDGNRERERERERDLYSLEGNCGVFHNRERDSMYYFKLRHIGLRNNPVMGKTSQRWKPILNRDFLVIIMKTIASCAHSF